MAGASGPICRVQLFLGPADGHHREWLNAARRRAQASECWCRYSNANTPKVQGRTAGAGRSMNSDRDLGDPELVGAARGEHDLDRLGHDAQIFHERPFVDVTNVEAHGVMPRQI